MKNENKKIQFILGLVISIILVATSFTTMGITPEKDLDQYFFNTPREVINKRIISVPDTSILLCLWDERLDNGNIAPFYGISLDGQSFVRITETSYELGLRYAHFDPLEWVPSV